MYRRAWSGFYGRCRHAGRRRKSALSPECQSCDASPLCSWRDSLLLLLQPQHGFLIVQPMLDLLLRLDDSSRILCFGSAPFAWDRDRYTRIVVAREFCDASRDCRLLPCRKLILARTFGSRLGGGALLVLWVDRDFGRVIASVDYVCPPRRNSGGRIWQDFNVRHGGLSMDEEVGSGVACRLEDAREQLTSRVHAPSRNFPCIQLKCGCILRGTQLQPSNFDHRLYASRLLTSDYRGMA